MGKKILITGGTGMIGGLILQLCLENDSVERVVSLVRKPSGIAHAKLIEVQVQDFLNLEPYQEHFQDLDTVFYCLGVYTGAVDRETFRAVTVDYPHVLAKIVVDKSPSVRFCLLSGAGADRKERSRFMFAKDKGEIENILSGMGFEAFHTFRPGYIYPVTKRVEPNFSYRLMRKIYPVMRVFGKNTSIPSTQLAAVIFTVGLTGGRQEIYENRDIYEAYQSSATS